jgi:hypothetical protein
MLALLDALLKKTDEYDSYGMWNVAGYFVSDDMSATDKITHTLKGSYTGATTAGTAEVTVTITAQDEAGKETKTTVVVTVSIRDDSAET